MGDETPQSGVHKQKTQEQNYYAILGCNEGASFNELKQSYQALIRKYHPDKQEGFSTLDDRFILIDKAFKTLKDEKLRREYDAQLLLNRINENSLIYAELAKDSLSFDDDGVAYFSCRCGDNFVIQQDFLVEQECIIECSECTNCILIK